MSVFVLILVGVLLNTAAQLMLKAGMSQIGQFEFHMSNLIPIGFKVLANPPILTGLVMYTVSVGVWLMVLSRIQVSLAYPMLSIGYVVNAVAANYLFGEPLTSARLIGIFVIMTGVYLVATSSSS